MEKAMEVVKRLVNEYRAIEDELSNRDKDIECLRADCGKLLRSDTTVYDCGIRIDYEEDPGQRCFDPIRVSVRVEDVPELLEFVSNQSVRGVERIALKLRLKAVEIKGAVQKISDEDPTLITRPPLPRMNPVSQDSVNA